MFKKTLRRRLEKVFPDQELTRWFDPLQMLMAEEDKTLRVRFPHPLFRRWFMHKVQKDFEREALSLAENFTIIYQDSDTSPVPGFGSRSSHSESLTAASVVNVVLPASPSKINRSQAKEPGNANNDFFFPGRHTFDNFLVNKKNDFSLAAAKESAQLSACGSAVAYTPLVIYGQSGSGKSHLLEAIAFAVWQEGLPVFFGDTAYLERLCISPGRFAPVSEHCLCIDDVQRAGSCSEMQEALGALIDKSQASGKLLALTLETHPAACEFFPKKLRNRLTSGLVVEMKRPDLDIRRQYAQMQNDALHADLSKEQMLSLAQRYHDIRSINGALTRLCAYRSMLKTEGRNTPGDQDVLLNQAGASAPLNPATIVNVIAQHFSVASEDIIGKSRDKRASLARHVAILLCRELVNLSLVQTGNFFGGRDHSSVLYSIKKIKQLQESNNDMNRTVESLRKLCLSRL